MFFQKKIHRNIFTISTRGSEKGGERKSWKSLKTLKLVKNCHIGISIKIGGNFVKTVENFHNYLKYGINYLKNHENRRQVDEIVKMLQYQRRYCKNGPKNHEKMYLVKLATKS